jgi:hypothetical protein
VAPRDVLIEDLEQKAFYRLSAQPEQGSFEEPAKEGEGLALKESSPVCRLVGLGKPRAQHCGEENPWKGLPGEYPLLFSLVPM